MKQFLTLVTFLIVIHSAQAADEITYVINTSAETLSKINLTTGVTTNDIVPLGSDVFCAPNQILVRDTLAFIVISSTDEIQVINLNTESTVTFIDLPTGSNPFWMVAYDTDIAYVTNLVGNSLAKIDLVNFTVLGEVPIGSGPEGMLIYDHRAYVANTNYDFINFKFNDGTIAVYDIPADTVMYEITVGTNPQYLAVDNENKIHVICTGNYGFGVTPIWGTVYVIDPSVDIVTDSLYVGGSPSAISIAPDNIAYIAATGYSDGFGSIFSYNTNSLTVYHDETNPIVVDTGCFAVVAYQDSSFFDANFADYIVQHDSAGNEINRYTLSDGPVNLDFNYMSGDVNGDFVYDIADLVYLVEFMFVSGDNPVWPSWRANVNGDFTLDISDLVHLVNFMFNSGPVPVHGSEWLRF